MQTGGKIYGSGAKGSVIDIFKQNDKEKVKRDYFADEKDDLDLIYYSKKDVYTGIPISESIKEQLKHFNIKIFKNIDSLESEALMSNKLNEIGLTTEFIINSNNDIDKKKYNCILNHTKGTKGLLKEKCSNTLDKYKLTKATNAINITTKDLSLDNVVKDCLMNIYKLNSNNYTHCDIKADNIMLCGETVKLIDWDKTVYTPEININNTHEICENDYTGSSSHTSPLMFMFYD